MEKYNNVIFFDGVCGLCNGFVDFIMKIDKKKQFLFSPLQSEFARTHLPQQLTQDLSSVVFLHNGTITTKSAAVIKVLEGIGGIWKTAKFGRYLPKRILDKAYDQVAANRYKLFGKQETCRLPTPEERARFVS